MSVYDELPERCPKCGRDPATRKADGTCYFDEHCHPCVVTEGLRQNCHRGTVGCYLDHPDACHLPPVGWWCSRQPGHDGPCAARRATDP